MFDAKLGRASCTRIEWLCAAVFGFCAVAYPVWSGFLNPSPEVDFRVFWFAGHLWNQNIDPYTSAFAEMGNASLPDGNRLYAWLYPPNWALICRALALFELQDAIFVWRGVSTCLMLAATGLLMTLLTRGLETSRRALLIAFACAMATVSEPHAIVLAAGQVSPAFIYLGIVLIAYGYLQENFSALVAGLIFVALKPQIGIVPIAALAVVPHYRRAVVAALAVSALIAAPHFVQYGLLTTVRNWTNNLPVYEALNSSLTLSGPGHLPGRVGIELPGSIVRVLAVFFGLVAALRMRANPHSQTALIALIATMTAIVPLQSYDMSILVPLGALMFFALHSRFVSGSIALTALLIIRPTRLESLFDLPIVLGHSGGVLVMSSAALLLFVIAFIALRAESRKAAEDAEIGEAAAA